MTIPVALTSPLLIGLRNMIVGESTITDELGLYNTEPSVHTINPVPSAADFPLIVIGPIVTKTDDDGINDSRPQVVLDVHVIGEQPRDRRVVDELADMVYALLHRKAANLSVTGWTVTNILCTGPAPGLTDDDSRISRRISLSVYLRATALA